MKSTNSKAIFGSGQFSSRLSSEVLFSISREMYRCIKISTEENDYKDTKDEECSLEKKKEALKSTFLRES